MIDGRVRYCLPAIRLRCSTMMLQNASVRLHAGVRCSCPRVSLLVGRFLDGGNLENIHLCYDAFLPFVNWYTRVYGWARELGAVCLVIQTHMALGCSDPGCPNSRIQMAAGGLVSDHCMVLPERLLDYVK